jgi:hypothetical protein
MNKKIILLALAGAVGGAAIGVLWSPQRKTAQARELFPAEKLAGCIQNAQLKVVKSRRTVGPVTAMAVVPYGIKPEQVSPTGYGALKTLHAQHPEAPWLAIFIAEDSAMAEASNWAGVAEFYKGEITVTGGLPTASQLDSLAKLGEPTPRPTPRDLKVAAAVFEGSGDVSSGRWELSQTLLGAGRTGQAANRGRFFDLDFETTVLHAAAKSLGKAPKEVQATARAVCRYYWLRAGQPL